MNCHLWADSHNHKDGEFLQWCIISRPRHPLIGAVIREIVARIITATEDQAGKAGVIGITGPLAFTEAILDAMPSENASHRITGESFSGNMLFNAITKDSRLTKHHHEMRCRERNYRLLTTPVVNPSLARRLRSKVESGCERDFARHLLVNFDMRHPPYSGGEKL
jgi:hypothetical protein